MGLQGAGRIGSSSTNPYLSRRKELHVFRKGLSPLSAIKDMIGSHVTKGMHALAKFVPHRVGTGVWTDGASLTAIAAYPSGLLPEKWSGLTESPQGDNSPAKERS